MDTYIYHERPDAMTWRSIMMQLVTQCNVFLIVFHSYKYIMLVITPFFIKVLLHLTVYNNSSTNSNAYAVTGAFKSWTPQDYRQGAN